MKQIIIFIFAIGVLICKNASGQPAIESANCPREKLQLHLSHESAFAGEICWFKIYCTSPLFPGDEISDLAFVELVGNENTSIIRKKILLTHGEGTGDFVIPDNLPTGLYYILAYTSWMKNFGEGSFFKKEFVIVNPGVSFKNRTDSTVPILKKEKITMMTIHEKGPEVMPDRDRYSLREKVTLRITSGNMSGNTLSGNLSVSVNRQEPVMVFRTGKNSEPPTIQDPENLLYRPDYKGIWLSGKLKDPTGQSLTGAMVILSLPGAGTDINGNRTDSIGSFHFLLKPKQGLQDAVITLSDATLKIDLDESFWNGFRVPPDNLMFGLDTNSIEYLKDKFAHYQLQAKFRKRNFTANRQVNNPADSGVFYSEPFRFIKMSNYITLDSLREYFYELVPSVKFTQHKGEFDISVIDQQTLTYIDDKPGVFLDGVLYDNYSRIAGIPPGEIDRMTILPTTYYYKNFTFGGIVDIHTKKADFNIVKPLPNMTRFLFPMANPGEWTFGAPDYTSADSTDRTPDFRYLLHWDPNVKADGNGNAEVSFRTGDLAGTYVVKVAGISKEGEIIQFENRIEVGN